MVSVWLMWHPAILEQAGKMYLSARSYSCRKGAWWECVQLCTAQRDSTWS